MHQHLDTDVTVFLCPVLKKEGHIALQMLVGMFVCHFVTFSYVGLLNLIQPRTRECFHKYRCPLGLVVVVVFIQ